MGMGYAERYGWTSGYNLEEHFYEREHARVMGYRTLRQYASAARNNINSRGTISRTVADGRTGHFNSRTNRLTITNSDGRIITFYEPTRGWAYFDERFPL